MQILCKFHALNSFSLIFINTNIKASGCGLNLEGQRV